MTRALAALTAVAVSLAACTGGTTGGDDTSEGDAPVVQTSYGPVRGAMVDGVRRFQGVRYAAPPVGGLRWRPPQPPAPWTEPADATRPGGRCVQTLPVVNLPQGSEDCLFVNVDTPDPAPSGAPVMVWIHGGGFTIGAGNDYAGSVLARDHGVVVVTLNYRLGALGFMAHAALSAEDPDRPASGNWGLADQQAALEWVRGNIEAFGGDPSNVTIFGESAGGISVCAHLLAPASAGLFHRAIDQSGPCAFPLPTLADAEVQGARLSDAVGCATAADELSCLRSVPARAIHDALAPDPTFVLGEGTSWIPVADGVVLDRQPLDALAAGQVNVVPTIMGSNADEGTLFVALAQLGGSEIDDARYRRTVLALVGDETRATAVLDAYPADGPGGPRAALAAVVGDALLACPTIRAADLLAEHAPVWRYSFEYTGAEFVLPVPFDLGAFHSAELGFLFGRQPSLGTEIDLDAEETTLAGRMRAAWAALAATGDPNTGVEPAWPRLDDGRAHLVLDTPVRVGHGLKADECAFWAELGWRPSSLLAR